MIIPKLQYISQGNSPKEHLENIQKACTSGAEMVLLDLQKVSDKKLLEVATTAREITAHFQTRLLLRGNYKIAKTVKADGVHLEKTDVCPSVARKHVFTWQLIGATANTLQDCETLLEKEVDYITLSPFRQTEKDDTITVLAINGFTLITEALQTETPIIGFGEITTTDVTAILATGVSGIAVADAITQDFDRIKEFNQLLKASSTEEQRHAF
ncbi:Thiamine-phosphate synthase [Polaribacter huanghezhanensis]|uniref:thiamine phosphate synthase n=1 Tax=Polaribacter huanghezhanensis TaxID=1354726 RepID=UPI002646FFFB|nr:thiamine phosphate synthase [Polaribacter huanghezhanensis]WKD86675.1 Thiamine-phosphate synthase [Polaribacter huanghezhanensis]